MNVVEALNLMRLDLVRTVHSVEHRDNFLGESDLLADRPVVVEKQNVGVDVEVASLDAPNEAANHLVEVREALKVFDLHVFVLTKCIELHILFIFGIKIQRINHKLI